MDSKPLQLIRLSRRSDFEESLELKLDTKVLDSVLQTCGNRKICVITVTGHAKSGKGLLLNIIKDRLQSTERLETRTVSGFPSNHKYKPFSEGISIWNKALMVNNDEEEIAVLLLETQGFQAGITKPDEITALLGISLLASSIVVINVTAELPKEAFDWLGVFAECGALFSAKGSAQPFQKLSFLVRDWTRLDDYTYGAAPGKKMLGKLLPKVGMDLPKWWEGVDCFLMPTAGGQVLLSTFAGNAKELGSEFLAKMQPYMKKLLRLGDEDGLTPKKILDNELTAKKFRQFMLAYVNLFNEKSMEWGLQPESVWRVTLETAGQIKLGEGVTAYKLGFKQRLDSSKNGYLLEETIEGIDVQARRKAVEAFKKWSMPRAEEHVFMEKLTKLLNKEKENVKAENLKLRKTKITIEIGGATEKLRFELTNEFPFTAEVGVSQELVFYDEETFYLNLETISKAIEQNFLKNFEGESNEKISELTELLEAVLQPKYEEYVEKNVGNKQRAVSLTMKRKKELTEKYKAEMADMVNHLPDTDSKTVAYFHDKIVKDIKMDFEKMKLGTASFQQKCLNELLDEIENEHEAIKMNLSSTQQQALEMVNAEVSNYRRELEDKASTIETEEIQNYHNSACKSILLKFSTKNPLERHASLGEELNRRLELALEAAYVDIVVNGVIAKRKVEEKIKKAVEAAVQLYKDEMRKIVAHQEFILEDTDFQAITATNDDKATELFDKQLRGIVAEAGILQNARVEVEDKLDDAMKAVSEENKKKRKVAEEKANTLFKKWNEELKSKLYGAVAMFRKREELLPECKRISDEILEYFRKEFPSRNQELLNNFEGMLGATFEETLKDVENFFEKTKQAENLDVMAELLIIRSKYHDRMEQEFKRKDGYFSEEELQNLHESVTATMSTTLNEDQRTEVNHQLQKSFEIYRDKNELIKSSFEDKDLAIGIDLGTTYCCVAVYRRGKVIIVRNSVGDNTTPSYVTIDADDSVTCGKVSKEVAFQNPDSTIFDVKRIIGRRMDDEKLQEDMKFWPFSVVDEDGNGKPKIEVHGKTYYPEEISAMLLKHLKKEAEQILGIPLRKAVITVPAYFTDGQRRATEDAGKFAGLEVLGILNEPSAAAMAYRIDHWTALHDNDGKPKHILVFDLGGGTFDVVLIAMSRDNIEVLSIGGDDHLGGEDFDKRMMTFCAEEFRQNTGVDLFLGKDSSVKTDKDKARRNLRRLQTTCEHSKKQLSTARKTTVSIDAIAEGQDLIVEMKKKQFEDLNEDLFKKTLEIVDDVLLQAKLPKKDVDEVVLVGGSTRITKLQAMLEQHFNGKALSKAIHPDEAVAYGAAIQASILNSKPGEKVFDFDRIQEVVPMTLGIETVGGIFDKIIGRNTKLPTEVTREYYTHRHNQPNVCITVLQGESRLAKDNRLLGEFVLEGIPPGKAREQAVNVTMKININGILTVDAVCKSTGGSKSITVNEDRGRMTEEEKENIMWRMANVLTFPVDYN